MPSRVRRYSGDETVLVPCSICGTRWEYPTEIRLCADKLWRCRFHWNEKTKIEEDRAVAASRRRRDQGNHWGSGS